MTDYASYGVKNWNTKRPTKFDIPNGEHYVTAMELMLALDELIPDFGAGIPVLFRDSDPRNSTWVKPVLYYGPVCLNDEKGKQNVFILSEVPEPFPNNCYLKDPSDDEETNNEEDEYDAY